jgi:L-iditol 2-dehydrogenase
MTEATMKAVVVRAPMEFGVEEVPLPPAPEGGFLLKVHSCGLCGSDLRTLRGGHLRVTFPWIIGHEVAGWVHEIGPSYAGPWKVGDLLAVAPFVYCGRCDFCQTGKYELCDNYREIAQAWPGGFAEYMPVPAEPARNGIIQPVPEGLDPALAAISEPIASCVHAQEKGWVGLGDSVVVIGSGPVGCTHVMLARARGAARVYLADVSEERLKMAEVFAPDALINAAQTDLVAEARRLTANKGADVVITANSVPATQVQAVEMARKGGRVLLFGGLPKTDSKPPIDMNVVHYNGLYLIGTTTLGPRHQFQALQLLASGRYPFDKLITQRFPLAEFRQGAMLALEGKALKAVFFP